MTSDSVGRPQEERIRDRAYRIWVDEGQPEGRYLANWLRAKREIEEEDGVVQGTEELTLAAPPAAHGNRE